jgi:hypothetical protein
MLVAAATRLHYLPQQQVRRDTKVKPREKEQEHDSEHGQDTIHLNQHIHVTLFNQSNIVFGECVFIIKIRNFLPCLQQAQQYDSWNLKQHAGGRAVA